MVDLIDTLIDKQDNFEIVRDQIAAILAAETISQQALAVQESKDPDLWKFSVYTERITPWEAIFNQSTGEITGDMPLINVWFDNGIFPGSGGDTVERQTHEGIFNVDCYGAAVTQNIAGTGHKSGDEEAAFEAQRIVKLARNILMAGVNTYLQLRGTVGQRWPQSITPFLPQQTDRPAQHLMAVRLALRVKFNEYSPQVTPTDLEEVAIEVRRAEDGKIIIGQLFDYT